MKKILMVVFISVSIFVLNRLSCFAIERFSFSFSLELVTPSGKVDGKSYFRVRIKNNDDSLSVCIPRSERYSYCRVFYDMVGIGETDRYGWFFFSPWYAEKSMVIIKPGEEYIEEVQLMFPIQGNGPGILPLSKESLLKIKRVRLKLEKIMYLLTPLNLSGFKPLKEEIDAVYSNWVDIKAEDFVRFFCHDEEFHF